MRLLVGPPNKDGMSGNLVMRRLERFVGGCLSVGNWALNNCDHITLDWSSSVTGATGRHDSHLFTGNPSPNIPAEPV